MSDDIITVGRQSISREQLQQFVTASNSVRDVQKALGWGMANTTTIKLGEAIKQAGINTEHFKHQIGAKKFDRELKQYNISEVNKPYWNYCEQEFPKIYSPESYKGTYRFIFGKFLEFIGEQDIMKIKGEEIAQFAEGKIMRENVIKAILKRIVIDDINQSHFKASKKLLFCLLDDGKMKK